MRKKYKIDTKKVLLYLWTHAIDAGKTYMFSLALLIGYWQVCKIYYEADDVLYCVKNDFYYYKRIIKESKEVKKNA